MENFFWDDIVRWKAGQFITRPLRGLYVPGPGEYDCEGDGDTDVVFYEGDAPGNQVEGIQYLRLGSDVYLSANNLIDPQPNFNNRSFDENRDYLYPIPYKVLLPSNRLKKHKKRTHSYLKVYKRDH